MPDQNETLRSFLAPAINSASDCARAIPSADKKNTKTCVNMVADSAVLNLGMSETSDW
jgi:hypothetical protein